MFTRTKNKVVVGLLCVPLAAFAVSHAKEAADPVLSAAPSPYPVLDSGVWADAIHSPTIFWLDNDRLIFKGTEATQKADAFKKNTTANLGCWKKQDNTLCHDY